MVSCKLKGGLGNQLFQISTTYALARQNNDVDCYNFYESELYFQGKKANLYFDSIYKKIKNKIYDDNHKFENFYNEPNHNYNPINYKQNLLLDGYFQSERYFEEFKNEIIDLFDLDDKKIQCIQFLSKFEKPVTSIHIRRGDYLQFKNVYNILDMDYYNRAIDFFPNNHFLVFYYDMDDWLQENFNVPNFTKVSFKDDILDLVCMSMCDNNIMSNSTFSWWSSYLNKNKNKIVISPKMWFSSISCINDQDIVPNYWIKI